MMRWLIPVALAVVVAIAVLARPSKSEPQQTCAEARTQVVPEWARTGFSDAEPKMPLVLGEHERIVAIVFGSPLYAPPKADRSNKILWVAKEPLHGSSDLRIRATRASDGKVAERKVAGGPGPSLIDLPEGCWKLQLSWSGRTDELDLRYRGAD
jgi:hypothetical protein